MRKVLTEGTSGPEREDDVDPGASVNRVKDGTEEVCVDLTGSCGG